MTELSGALILLRRVLFRDSLLRDGRINLFGLVVGGFGGGSFAFADTTDFGIPADIDSLLTPFGTLAAGADRFAGDFDENRIRVARWQDAQGDPA